MKHKLDSILSSWISKKLLVFLFASFFLLKTRLNSEDWVNIAMIYILTQGSIDAIKSFLKK